MNLERATTGTLGGEVSVDGQRVSRPSSLTRQRVEIRPHSCGAVAFFGFNGELISVRAINEGVGTDERVRNHRDGEGGL